VPNRNQLIAGEFTPPTIDIRFDRTRLEQF